MRTKLNAILDYQKDIYKNQLKRKGENYVYDILEKQYGRYFDNRIHYYGRDLSVKEFIDMLKAEIDEESKK